MVEPPESQLKKSEQERDKGVHRLMVPCLRMLSMEKLTILMHILIKIGSVSEITDPYTLNYRHELFAG